MQTYPPGTRIGQYEIASRPMMGGMGVVYFALDHSNDGRPVALKTFRPEFLPDRAARDRFLREGTAWVELGNHPHIVRCYKVVYFDPTAFLVLELIAKEQNMPNASLRSWLIPGRPLPVEQALLFALQIARGMQHAIEKIPGFVHRDLKPENILVGADKLPGTNINRVRVTDFGLAKTILDLEVPKTETKTEELKPNQIQFTRGVGTPLYMAPEQWKGEPVGVFTDVYAFGCILFEMLSGKSAAEGKSIAELRVSHCDGKLQPISRNTPHDIVALTTKCLVSNPTHRYRAWYEIIGDLEHIYTIHSRHAAPQLMDARPLSREEKAEAGWSYNEMGVVYREMGNAKMSMLYFEKALAAGQTEGLRELSGSALGNLGLANSNLGNTKVAIEYYRRCLEIHREIGAGIAEGATLLNLGIAYKDLGNARQAIGYFEQALAISRQIVDRYGVGKALLNIGIAHKDLGEFQEAIGDYEQALVIYRELGDRRGEGIALCNLGLAAADLGNVQDAIVQYQEALAIAREIGDPQLEGDALANLGIACAMRGDTQRAIQYYERSLAISQEIGNRDGEGTILLNLGIAYKNLGDFQQAIRYYERSLRIYQEIGNRLGEGSLLGNLGNVYAALGNTTQAMEYYKQRLEIARELGDLKGIAFVSHNMALLYIQRGEAAHALPLVQEAEQAFTHIGHREYAQAARALAKQLQKLVNK